jgi:Ca-activated chloride channel homolog
LAAAAGLVVVVPLAVWAVVRPGSLLPCLGDRITVRTAAAPSLAPSLRTAAERFNDAGRARVGRSCVQVQISQTAPKDAVAALSTAGSEGSRVSFDVWIPDSTSWVAVASRRPEVAPMIDETAQIVATSPSVFAMPRPQAEALGWPGRQPSLAQLVALAKDPSGWASVGRPAWGRMRLSWTDPRDDAAGLAALMAVYRESAGDAGDEADVQQSLIDLQAPLRSVAVDRAAAQRGLVAAGTSDDAALRSAVTYPTTEQAVVAFNATSPSIPLAALYPTEGVTPGQVPFVPVQGAGQDRRVLDASRLFADYLTSDEGSAPLASAGFRSLGAGRTTSTDLGAVPSEPAFTPAASTVESVARALQYWSALQERGNVLVVVDVSGSMLERVPGQSVSRLDLARAALADALAAYSSNASVGLWAFSRRLDGERDYRQVVPLAGPAEQGALRRERLRRAALSLQAGGDTGLYDTTAAAFQDVRRQVRAGKNLVVVLSDGRNDDPGSISLARLVSDLSAGQPASGEIRIDTIAYGAEADSQALRSISRATRGRTYGARSPADLRTVLLTALSSS